MQQLKLSFCKPEGETKKMEDKEESCCGWMLGKDDIHCKDCKVSTSCYQASKSNLFEKYKRVKKNIVDGKLGRMKYDNIGRVDSKKKFHKLKCKRCGGFFLTDKHNFLLCCKCCPKEVDEHG